VDRTIADVRRIASELRPSLLDDLGLVEAIAWHLHEFHERTGLAWHFHRAVPAGVPFGAEQSTALFRILQEALTNIARHAGASRVDVSVFLEPGAFIMTVQDDGIGISDDAQRLQGSLGLLGMRERAYRINGSVEIRRADGRGTIVTVRVPQPVGNDAA
jgi:signal transduction histidine kinase